MAAMIMCHPAWAERTIRCENRGIQPIPRKSNWNDSLEIRQTPTGYEITDDDLAKTKRSATVIFETQNRRDAVLSIVERRSSDEEEVFWGATVFFLTVDFENLRVERYQPGLRLGKGFWPGEKFDYDSCARLD
jgi:hypothetical protein